ncbi:unnamed protein product [Lymnaea stagnalis]|uniref:Uncharacterized protein n=1 Tax=Lymnaea stagnalis TaxID=6523 RepID=A0AAV2H722_LYMST
MKILHQVILFLLFALAFILRLHRVFAIEPYLVLNYENINIHFDASTFTRFYKCLCNIAMAYCVATTETFTLPVQQVSIVEIDPIYTGIYFNPPRRKCVIDKYGRSNLHLVINCTAPVEQCQLQITLIPHNNENNDKCRSAHVEVAWKPGVNVTNHNTQFIEVKYCEADNHTEEFEGNSEIMNYPTTSNVKESTVYRENALEASSSQSEVDAKLNDAIKIVSVIVGTLVLAFVFVAVFVTTKRRNKFLRMHILKENSDEQDNPIDKCGHYQTIDSPRSSVTCVHQGAGYESTSALHIASAEATVDSGYTIIDIVDTSPGSSMPLRDTCSNLHNIDSTIFNKKDEHRDSGKKMDKSVSRDQFQEQSSQIRSLIDLPRVPGTDASGHTNGRLCKITKPFHKPSHDTLGVIHVNVNAQKRIKEEDVLEKMEQSSSPRSSSSGENYNMLQANKAEIVSDCKVKLPNPVSRNQVLKGNKLNSLYLEQKELNEVKDQTMNKNTKSSFNLEDKEREEARIHSTPGSVIIHLNGNFSRYSKSRKLLRENKNYLDVCIPTSQVLATGNTADGPKTPTKSTPSQCVTSRKTINPSCEDTIEIVDLSAKHDGRSVHVLTLEAKPVSGERQRQGGINVTYAHNKETIPSGGS